MIDVLTKYGGKRDTYLSEMVSHVIADDIENHEYQEARELFELPCVMVGTFVVVRPCAMIFMSPLVKLRKKNK